MREELRQAYVQMRSRVADLVAEIPQDLRDFTVHDVTHLDALWEMADLISGEDYHPTPAEGFIFGGALLLHDAGMALCALPSDLSSMQNDARWQDSLAILWQQKTGRVARRIDVLPGGAATQDAELIRRATAEVLRFRHAERAERLLTQTWQLPTGEHYQILENANLRDTYGVLIGQLAHSHWWPVERLEQSFKRERPAPDRFPPEWKVDPLKIACLLRAADAIHLDQRRAPRFLQALRRPEGYSQLHWDFQGKMLRPQLIKELGLVEFVSSSPFALAQKDAWWLGFDTLESVDKELRDIDTLLVENGRSRFAARGVAHIGVPTRLSQTIQVEGWSPVDARLHVGDVARLARTLGGEQLYGRSQSVPLRELIQNASDARTCTQNFGITSRGLGKRYSSCWTR